MQEPLDQKLLAVQARLDLLQKSLIDKKIETVEYILDKLDRKRSVRPVVVPPVPEEVPVVSPPSINTEIIEHISRHSLAQTPRSLPPEPYTPVSMRTPRSQVTISHETLSEINSIWKNFMILCTEGSYVFFIIKSLNLESRLKLIAETLNYAEKMRIKIHNKELRMLLEGISDLIIKTGVNAKDLTQFVGGFIRHASVGAAERYNIETISIIKTQISYITSDPLISIFVVPMQAKLATLEKLSNESYSVTKKILHDLSKEIEHTGKTISNTTVHTAELFNVLIKILQ
ncbi:MAG: hypothetical protein Hyperionvirus15_25 [Hyperionvirus sp.]|uniref:Uncharacterized protein n=1 Tax=Hyperionvirus sp. TaxID=2487770 RepID=A0A3G5A9P6_9VIRU|nr:MAG: hypothetical protein Hyperionvirus15_25 [Hyperionvirus sp.]